MTSAREQSGASAPRPESKPASAAPEHAQHAVPASQQLAHQSTSASLDRALERTRGERDDALRHSLEVERQRDLGQELALRFEREFEDERRALAQSIQDELGQHAVAIRTIAATLESRLAGREPSLAQLALMMVRSADALSASVRAAIHRIRPEPLEHGGLLEGLRSLLAEWGSRRQAVRFELLVEPAGDVAFGLGAVFVEAAAWRIVAEAVENAVEHGCAGTVVVSVRREAGMLTLQVSDDGPGLAARRTEGAGLRAMRERALACGGSVTVANGESGGVEVLACLPWPGGTASMPST
jgi:two-component system sensor histidine kinase UhpB